MSRSTVVSILLLFLFPMFTTADIRNIKITSDRRHGILFQRFGFKESGHVSISIESPTFTSVRDPSRLAFFIIPTEDTISQKWNFDINSDCLLDGHGVRILFNFTQLNNSSSFSQSFPITLPDVYSLYFANCQPESRVTMSVTTTMYNLDNNGALKDYLPAGQTQSDIVYVVFAAIYFVFCLVWLDISVEIREKHFWTRMSMSGLILMKALNLVCAAVDQHYLKFTGISHGWDVIVCIFQLSRVIFLCCVIAQIGIRWSILHPRVVQITMIIVLIIMLPLQVIADINFTAFLETRLYLKNSSYLLFKSLFIYGGFSCGIFLTVSVWTICFFVLLHGFERTAPTVAKGVYYALFEFLMIWWFLSSFLVPAWKIIYGYKIQTVLNVIEESATLVTYVGTICTFGHAIHTNAIQVANPAEEGLTLDRESASNV